MHCGNAQQCPFQRALQLGHGTQQVGMDGLGPGGQAVVVVPGVGGIGLPLFVRARRIRALQPQPVHQLQHASAGNLPATRRRHHLLNHRQQLGMVEWGVEPVPGSLRHNRVSAHLLFHASQRRFQVFQPQATLLQLLPLQQHHQPGVLQPFQLGDAEVSVGLLVLACGLQDDAGVEEESVAAIAPELGLLINLAAGRAAKGLGDLIRLQALVGATDMPARTTISNASLPRSEMIAPSFASRMSAPPRCASHQERSRPRRSLQFIPQSYGQCGLAIATGQRPQHAEGLARTDTPVDDQALGQVAPGQHHHRALVRRKAMAAVVQVTRRSTHLQKRGLVAQRFGSLLLAGLHVGLGQGPWVARLLSKFCR